MRPLHNEKTRTRGAREVGSNAPEGACGECAGRSCMPAGTSKLRWLGCSLVLAEHGLAGRDQLRALTRLPRRQELAVQAQVDALALLERLGHRHRDGTGARACDAGIGQGTGEGGQ